MPCRFTFNPSPEVQALDLQHDLVSETARGEDMNLQYYLEPLAEVSKINFCRRKISGMCPFKPSTEVQMLDLQCMYCDGSIKTP